MSELEAARRSRRRNWIWVFVALALLGLLAIVINWSYSASQPLTAEQLRAAREFWARNGPSNYDLKIKRIVTHSGTVSAGGTTVDEFNLQVRGGKVTNFLLNGRDPEPLLDRAGKRNFKEEQRQRSNYDINGLFEDIERFMELEGHEKGRTFMRARFDKTDGHVIAFSHQKDGKRMQIQVELKKID